MFTRPSLTVTTRIVTTRLGLPLLAAAAFLGAVGVGPARADTTPVIYGSSWLHGTGVNACANSAGGSTCGGDPAVGTPWQCVELAQRLYYRRHWYTANSGYFPGVQKAYQIYDQAPVMGMTRQPNGSITSIVPGDMIIHASVGGSAGHVAVVDRVVGNTVYVVEENWSKTDTASYTLSGGTLSRGSALIRGVVHSPNDPNTGGGTPGSTSSTPSSVLDAQGNPVIYFRGANNLLQQTHWVTGQGWVTDSPSDLPSGVAMAGDPTAVLDNQGNPIIYFRGTNNLLQQTHWVTGQGWVTDSNSGMAMAGNPSAVDAQGNPVIYFRGANNLLQQTHWVTGQGWVTDSPSDLPSGVAMAGDPTAVLDNQGNPIIYFRGTNNLLQQTHWVTGQGWVTDSNSGMAMAGNPSAVDAQGNPVIYFRGANNLLQQTHWVTGQGWVTDSPSDLPSGVAMAGDPTAVLDNQGNPIIYFRGTNNLLQQTHWVTGQGWVTDSNSGMAMAGNPSAVDAQGNPVIYFRGANNLLQQTHWVTGQGWVTDSPSDLPSGVSF